MGRSYQIIPREEGFRVEAEPDELDTPDQPEWFTDFLQAHGHQRQPATVLFRPTYIEIEPTHHLTWEDGEPLPGVSRTTLVGYRDIVCRVASTLMAKWAPRTPPRGDISYLRHWALEQTRRGIGTRVHAEWRRLLLKADPVVVSVQRKVFSATFPYRPNPLLFSPEFYRQMHLVSDVLAFRAAASLFAHSEIDLDKLAKWRLFFCPDGMKPYRALNKTLDQLPGGVPAPMLLKLKEVLLPRPITRRLELIATILAGDARSRNFHVFAHARHAQVKEVMARVSRSVFPDGSSHYSTRRTEDIAGVVSYLDDFPEVHRGNIVGLADKAIRWHRRDRQEEVQRQLREHLGNNTPTAKPPMPLPDLPGVRFLATVGEVADEGKLMNHCIASYAEKARDGLCYLFHVDFDGHMASVEVSPQSFVVQAQGPGNIKNNATAHGVRVLAAWARQVAGGQR
jgi:hypothetical protein